MTEILAHHLYGPSKLENYDPRSGGCYAFLSSREESEKAVFGSIKHQAVSTRDLSLLGGNQKAEVEVSKAVEFIDKESEPFTERYHEITLRDGEKIFGTLDFLGLSYLEKAGIIIDLKFGAWSVTNASKNLQGWAYVLLAFKTCPWLKKIRMVFYMAKDGTFTHATFWRYRLPDLEKRIYKIVDRAERVSKAPVMKDYTPNAINCSFCTRINCPARLAMMGTLVTEWTGQPVELPKLDLLKVTTPQLGRLKQLSNVFKSFASAVDAEAKRRAFDEDDIVEGYEIAEKSGPRTVVNASNLTKASVILNEEWNKHFQSQDWGGWIADNMELSIADLEKKVSELAPKGKASLAKKILVDALESAGLINATKIFYLSAIKE